MEHQSFFPRSTRNRIALVLGALSLMLFVTWNLMPDYKYFGKELIGSRGHAYQTQWIELLHDLNRFTHAPDRKAAWFIMFEILIILQCLVMLSLIPAWKFWQSSLFIRVIPAVMLICGFLLASYFFFVLSIEAPPPVIVFRSLITATFLTTALSLLCFKNEWIEPETPH